MNNINRQKVQGIFWGQKLLASCFGRMLEDKKARVASDKDILKLKQKCIEAKVFRRSLKTESIIRSGGSTNPIFAANIP